MSLRQSYQSPKEKNNGNYTNLFFMLMPSFIVVKQPTWSYMNFSVCFVIYFVTQYMIYFRENSTGC